MTGAWVGLATIAAFTAIYVGNKVAKSIADARDTIEEILDATLNPTPTGGWTTQEPPLLSPEFREWDNEVRDYQLKKPGSTHDPR